MRRPFVWSLIGMGSLLFFGCMGLAFPLQMVAYLLLGWAHYLYRVVPQVEIDKSGAATGVVCLVLLTAGVHLFAGWLYDQLRGSKSADDLVDVDRWRMRWTAWLVGGVLLIFVAGIATVGVTHQTGWLLFSDKPIVSSTSFAAFRAMSTNNLKQMGLALYNYSPAHDVFPPAIALDSLGRPLFGWQTMILPLMDHAEIYDRIDLKAPWNDLRNRPPYQSRVQEFLHPGIHREKDTAGYALSHYAGNGAFLGGTGSRTVRDVTDGTAQTIAAGEAVSNFKPWGDPTNWRDLNLGINQAPDGFGGPAPGGANFLFVDGSVHFVRDNIDPRILKALGTPAGGEKIATDRY
jgi:prepilin-type processing-associated H-X9-DG protein